MKKTFLKIIGLIGKKNNSEKGMALVMVMVFIALMSTSLMSLAIMVKRDMHFVERIKKSDQARFLAEAGIHQAFADIKANGFSSKSDFNGTLSTGSYSVQYSTVSGRELITSVGTASGVTATVTVEVRDNTPTAMNYFSGAGNNISIFSLGSSAEIIGDIHANNNVNLYADPIFTGLSIIGEVSASNIVKEGSRLHATDNLFFDGLLDRKVYINGVNEDRATIYESEPHITFPDFNYTNYRQKAIDSGDYYPADTTFTNATLSPANGIVFVDGDVTFVGTCRINGGVIADSIVVMNTSGWGLGTLIHNNVGDRNVIIARNGDIRVWGRLVVDRGLVYASQDIVSVKAFASFEVEGVFLAGRNVVMWDVITHIDYSYASISPADMGGEGGSDIFEVVSWTR